ncbi:PaaI family thioesterase [Trueperella pyogenes]|uniref:PaaI family thioesterase n=1 Tax=Trueperella pyogenes TaxID=1661 RepID=UPI000F84F2DB|nr:PaaI family thioesterase [Trueperella pyogenes]AZR00442.1 PaaI family thioesterase [Trueperella pyogenes]
MTTLDKTLDITVETSTKDACTVSMPTAHAFQPYGVVHGGINAVLVEHAGSILALANAPDGKVAVGSEISVSHLAPNATELVRATASVIKIARSSITVSVTVTDAHGDTTAVGRLTCVFISV